MICTEYFGKIAGENLDKQRKHVLQHEILLHGEYENRMTEKMARS